MAFDKRFERFRSPHPALWDCVVWIGLRLLPSEQRKISMAQTLPDATVRHDDKVYSAVRAKHIS
jgi:hypothetical protein